MGWIQQIVILLDLELLRDSLYISIMLSISAVMFVEMNFTSLMPLILSELNLEMESIATMLSALGIADLVFRGLAPYVGEWLHQPPMSMFLSSLVMVVIARTGNYIRVHALSRRSTGAINQAVV
jgi:sugar phosphate permease